MTGQCECGSALPESEWQVVCQSGATLCWNCASQNMRDLLSVITDRLEEAVTNTSGADDGYEAHMRELIAESRNLTKEGRNG